MSFGKKSSAPAQPTATFTPKEQTQGSIVRSANSAEAQDRIKSTSDPQSALLASGDEEEQRKRMMSGGGSNSGLY